MQNSKPEGRAGDLRTIAASRTIDVTDRRALRFWSKRLGVSPDEIAAAVKEVGPNTTAVALKLEAPFPERIAPTNLPPR